MLPCRYMLDKEIQQFIQDNDLVRIQASPMSEALDLWEDPGGHVWNWEMIQKAVKLKNVLRSLER